MGAPKPEVASPAASVGEARSSPAPVAPARAGQGRGDRAATSDGREPSRMGSVVRECTDELGVTGFNPEPLAMLSTRISFVTLMDRWRSFGNERGRERLLVFIRH